MTLDEILAGLAAGTLTRGQAKQHLQTLLDEAKVAVPAAPAPAPDESTDLFARAALTGLIATGDKWPSKEELLRECFSYAEAAAAVKRARAANRTKG